MAPFLRHLRHRKASITRVTQRHDTAAGYEVLERSEGQEVHREARVTPPDADGDITPLRVQYRGPKSDDVVMQIGSVEVYVMRR